MDVVAFYLPQFHPIPENDLWWGKGFTEWTNVAKSRPRFRGHYQPHIPADLGFYDLRLPEAREAQASLAAKHGITAFCYYHYWFNGRRVLERPLEAVRQSGRPDHKFAVCWANENWTRVWDGGSGQVLLEQEYSESDDLLHIRELAHIFADPRYLTVDGRPVLLVYRAGLLPDPSRTAAIWRAEVARLGFPGLHLCRVESLDHGDPHDIGFDAAIEFQPDQRRLPDRIRPNRAGRAIRRILRPGSAYRHNSIYEYVELADRAMQQPPAPYTRYRCVTPGWDNSPRREVGARIFKGSTPVKYQEWLEEAARDSQARDCPLLFINAWNEWGEGNHLEPDQRWGAAFLRATEAALTNALSAETPSDVRLRKR